ncbi:WD40/YVTN/BNR-like repeat-containing protein [Acanthopleuribacter pedis]|uniref:Sortilin N-terminal domain-containing protein n=1 Tax=Acanthopleuribacter pedis TaxID=442870 RepID=A0A8J7QCY7_9BACT|nr:hypothetical protein [Acanthopleuribacter pedis]MBO1321834.1 hypothetical protein [Acanthopleuribacter pedis]
MVSLSRPMLLFFALIFAAVLIFSGSALLSPPTATETAQQAEPLRPRTPGSYNGLSAWSRQRAWPHPVFPKQGFHRAYQAARRNLSAAEVLHKRETLWQSVPALRAGRTLALEFHPTKPNILYAGSASGGLWVTETADTQPVWRRVTTGYPVLGVAAIAVNPNQPDHILIGTGEVYGYKETFPGVAHRETRGSYGIGILQSRDGGETWRPVLDWREAQGRGVQDIAYDPVVADRVWAATTEGVFRSDDGGRQWSLSLDVPMATSLVVFPNHAGRIVAACGGFASADHGLYLGTDGGRSWQKIRDGVPESFGGKAILHAAPQQPDLVFASIGNDYRVAGVHGSAQNATWLCRSTDAGATWTVVNEEDYSGHQGWYSHFAHVDASRPDHVWVGGLFMQISRDNGANIDFLPPDNGLSSFADFHAMATSPHDPNFMVVAADQGIVMTRDGGNHWVSAYAGYQTLQFYNGTSVAAVGANQLVGTVQDHYGSFWVVEDENGGRMEQRFVGHEAGYVVLDPSNPERVLVGGPFMTFLDGGIAQAPPICAPNDTDCDPEAPAATTSFNAPVVMPSLQPGRLYAGRNTVWVSDNWGQNWRAGNGGSPLGRDPLLALAVAPGNADVVVTATAPDRERMRLFTSRDGGETWAEITANLPDRYVMDIAVDPRDDRVFTLVLSGFGADHVYRSRDGGATWVALDGGLLPDLPTTAVVLDPAFPEHIYIGNDLGVFVSLDDGFSWFSLTAGLPEAVLVGDLNIDPETRMLLLATHGNGVFLRPLLEPLPAGGDATAEQVALLGDLRHGAGVVTRLGVHNPGETETELRLHGFTASGALVESSTRVTRLASGARVELAMDQWFDQAPSAVRWVRIESDLPLVAFAERSDAETRSAWLAQPPATTTYMPHIAKDTAQFRTALFALNPATAAGETRLTGFPAGVAVQADGLGQGLHGKALEMADLFGADLSNTDWGLLVSEVPLTAVERFSRVPAEKESAAMALRGTTSETLHFLHVAADTDLFWTGLVYINVGEGTANITEEHYDAAGNLLKTQLLSLGARQKETLLFDRTNMLGNPDRYPPGTAWVRVRSSQPLIGYELFGAPTTSGNELFAGIQSDDQSAVRLLYPRLRANENAWTGLVVVNTGETPVAATARLYDDAGALLATQNLAILAPASKTTVLLGTLFPDHTAEAGSLIIEGDQNQLAGFLLWGDHNGETRRFLAGLNAVPLREP